MVDVCKQVSLPKHNLKESLFMCFNLHQEFGILGCGNTNRYSQVNQIETDSLKYFKGRPSSTFSLTQLV